jgi:uncharacterized protein YbjQ (UPF0145 family)
MSVEITHDVWVPGTVVQAHYGGVSVYAERERGTDCDELLEELLRDLERQAEALGANYVTSLTVDVAVGEKGTQWVIRGAATKLEKSTWW